MRVGRPARGFPPSLSESSCGRLGTGTATRERAVRIMILEDDPFTALDLQSLVEECGHEVVGLCSSLSAMRARLGETPDFAFLDIDLPDGKSFEIAARLDERRIPFAFVSASRQSDVPEPLRHARFIAKPYAGASIRNALRGDNRLAG